MADSSISGPTSFPSGKDPITGNRHEAEGEDRSPPLGKEKGSVDVEKQCGVALPGDKVCARSLTCKRHSMGSKRAVWGRSLPYDMLLAQHQKKLKEAEQR